MLWVCIISIAFITGDADGAVPIFRILGGNKVDIRNYPYVVSVQMLFRGQRMHICGGTLIAPNTILTAAHCFRSTGNFVVKAGSNSLKDSRGCVVPINKVIYHPQYKALSQDYDIAIAQLRKPVKLSKMIQPVKLPSFSKEIPLTKGTVLGWGATGYGASTSDDLRAVEIPIIDDKDCVQSYPKGLVTERMFCAKDDEGTKDSCQGDSGGPLIINGTIYGIVSWGFDCGNPDNPGVYSRVPYFADFINKTLNQKISRYNRIKKWIRGLY
ncbi:trypsin-2-like [Harmonia axyridis]|uniref:trypsin-2-like n=1 Tax=Harmonia axyridis TaxID=115357 RepID=UPI001E2756E3|nr:trypsin-2-like [Harmonia axyridis]